MKIEITKENHTFTFDVTEENDKATIGKIEKAFNVVAMCSSAARIFAQPAQPAQPAQSFSTRHTLVLKLLSLDPS